MPSPFPGMDPFIEAQGNWQGFHNSLITYAQDALNATLPETYFATADEVVRLVSPHPDPSGLRRPDLGIVTTGSRPSRLAVPTEPGGVSTMEPVVLGIEVEPEIELRETWLEIRRLPDRELITVLEILSPTNKDGYGRGDYLVKRRQILDQNVHLVEIDLLCDGHRLPYRQPLPAADYYASIARVEHRPNAHVYAWTVQEPAPTLPIPLRAPDPDVALDLNALIQAAYQRGRYRLQLDYTKTLDLPLASSSREWTEERLRSIP